MKKFLFFMTTTLLAGSFTLAVYDKDFRDDYGRLAVPTLKILVYLSEIEKKSNW